MDFFANKNDIIIGNPGILNNMIELFDICSNLDLDFSDCVNV